MATKRKNTKTDVYQQVTDTIIKQLEKAGSWARPWALQGDGAGMPVNPVSGTEYRGVNVPLLWVAQDDNGFTSRKWATFKQWNSVNLKVRKGEKATGIVFWKMFLLEDEKGEPVLDQYGEQEKRMFAKHYNVFNLDQVDGDKAAYEIETALPTEAEQISTVDAFVRKTKAIVKHGGNRAFYRHSNADPSGFIQMPPREAFKPLGEATATETYYGVLLHELTHWTGSPRRLDRTFGKRFGDDKYAAEELVAELGAAMLCAKLGISQTVREDHASYIKSWLEVLKADNRAIFTAASKAQQAVDHLEEYQAEPVMIAAE